MDHKKSTNKPASKIRCVDRGFQNIGHFYQCVCTESLNYLFQCTIYSNQFKDIYNIFSWIFLCVGLSIHNKVKIKILILVF